MDLMTILILNRHFIPGLINKLHNAKLKRLEQIEIFGTGNPEEKLCVLMIYLMR